MSESGCLPGRGGLKLQGEQGQQVQRGLAGCSLGYLCHGDLPREQESQGDNKAGRGGGDISGPWRRTALSRLSSPKLFSSHVPQLGLSSAQRSVSCLPTLLPHHWGCGQSYLTLQELHEGTPQSLAPSQVLAQAGAGMAASIEDLRGREERCIPAPGDRDAVTRPIPVTCHGYCGLIYSTTDTREMGVIDG